LYTTQKQYKIPFQYFCIPEKWLCEKLFFYMSDMSIQNELVSQWVNRNRFFRYILKTISPENQDHFFNIIQSPWEHIQDIHNLHKAAEKDELNTLEQILLGTNKKNYKNVTQSINLYFMKSYDAHSVWDEIKSYDEIISNDELNPEEQLLYEEKETAAYKKSEKIRNILEKYKIEIFYDKDGVFALDNNLRTNIEKIQKNEALMDELRALL
jgi:hypothetical protein